jgi:hypothetical protein
MTKRAEHSTKLGGDSKQQKTQPAPQTGKNDRDARDDDSQLSQNQKELGVGEDHKTDDMDQGKRGTFP